MDIIRNKRRKVLIGFKCAPKVRITLCEQSDRHGVTLSSHVEAIVSAHLDNQTELQPLQERVKELEQALAFYENSTLKELYYQFKGKAVSYMDKSGETEEITINCIQDIYTVLINSFKTTQ